MFFGSCDGNREKKKHLWTGTPCRERRNSIPSLHPYRPQIARSRNEVEPKSARSGHFLQRCPPRISSKLFR